MDNKTAFAQSMAKDIYYTASKKSLFHGPNLKKGIPFPDEKLT